MIFFIFYSAYISEFTVVCVVPYVLCMCLIHVIGIKDKKNDNKKINKKKKNKT